MKVLYEGALDSGQKTAGMTEEPAPSLVMPVEAGIQGACKNTTNRTKQIDIP
jgi:hypothetical protein